MNAHIPATPRTIHPREVWHDEEYDFTPWLAENLGLLSEAIGTPLEFIKREARVPNGQELDILARNSIDQSLVAIENQLNPSDDDHLYRLKVYASELGCRTGIWIADQFSRTHLSTLSSLNEDPSSPCKFLATRIKVVQVRDAPPAPLLERVDLKHPARSQLADRDAGEKNQHLIDFWNEFKKLYPDAPIRPTHKTSWLAYKVQEAGLRIVLDLAPYPYIRRMVRVFLRGYKRGENIDTVRDRIQRVDEAAWEYLKVEPDGDLDGRFCMDTLRIHTRDRCNWPIMARWMHERCEAYRAALLKYASQSDD